MKGALLLGRPADPHVRALVEELPRHGLDPRVLDPRRFPAQDTLSIRVRPGAAPEFDTALADLDDVRVGWFTSQESVRLSGQTAARARRYARAAAVAGLLSLRQAGRFPWVNDPWRAGAAGDKVWQLLVAREHGLRVPDTLLTNDPAAFRRFVRGVRRAAVKSPSGSLGLPDRDRILTQAIGPRDLADADTVRLAPVLAQEYVPKRTEVRATVVGGAVFAVEIHSQATARTRVDWRRYDPATPYAPVELPAAVRRACVGVTRACGLAYAGIDLIRTPDDDHVFLEANSEPAWLWAEDQTGHPITRAIAGLLARRARTARPRRPAGPARRPQA